jgi:hypothetical protein
MPFASSAGARIAFVAESTFGTIPTSPTFQVARVTGGGLRTTKTTGKSNELQADRNVRDEFLLGLDASGSYPFELTYGSLDAIMEAALFGAWSANVLKNGVTRRSFTIEETLELGATDSYHRFSGAMINTLSLDITAKQAVTGAIGVMAKQESLGTGILAGSVYTAANIRTPMTAAASVGALSVASLSPAPKIRRITFEANNNLRARPVIGSPYSEEFGEGDCDVTGSIEAYFDSQALYSAVLAHGGGALVMTIGHVSGEKYTVNFPNIVFLDGVKQIGGNNDDVMVNVPFRAKYDSVSGASMSITRAVA